MEIQSKISSKTPVALQEKILQQEYSYARLGLVVGVLCILGGIALFMNGVAGSTSWTAKILGAESKMSDAAPGALLFFAGVLVTWITRPKFEHK